MVTATNQHLVLRRVFLFPLLFSVWIRQRPYPGQVYFSHHLWIRCAAIAVQLLIDNLYIQIPCKAFDATILRFGDLQIERVEWALLPPRQGSLSQLVSKQKAVRSRRM